MPTVVWLLIMVKYMYQFQDYIVVHVKSVVNMSQ
jgi:hypothetical protein